MKTNHFRKANNKSVRRKGLVWLFSLIMCLFSVSMYAQESQVTGKVTDQNNNALPGINILVKGTTTGTITDVEGNYSLDLPSQDATVVFSAVGYISQEFTVSGSQVIDVVLEEDITDLGEIVVIGYGVQQKSLVTGAISSIDNEDMVTSVQRVEQALQGKAAGVTVLPNSGAPGAGMKVRIRGTGSNGNAEPLYIIDGMKSGDMNYLNPEDIASIEVLKDAASSAIYGTEGANGVVIITTKSGSKGQSNVDYSFSYGMQYAPNMPSLMNAEQYSIFMNEIYDPAENPTLPNPANFEGVAGTNWFDKSFEPAPMLSHNLSFNGGNEKTTYLFSAGYFSQDGIIGRDKSSFKRTTLRLNATHEVKKWLEIGNNVAFTNSNRTAVEEDDGFNGVINSMIMMDPTIDATYSPDNLPTHMQDLVAAGEPLVTDDAGNYYGITPWLSTGEIYNPLIRIANNKDNTVDNKLLGSAYLKLKPLEGLSITSRIGLDLAYQSFNSYSPSYYANTDTRNTSPMIDIDERRWSTWLWENFASYNKSFGEHNLSLVAGLSAQEYKYNYIETESGPMVREEETYRYPNWVLTEDNDDVDGSMERITQQSYFGRVSYDYANKYMLQATLRRDGSSLFGPDNKWGNFPSVSAGWVLSKEDFWPVDQINHLKFRASWGVNGSVSNLTPDNFLSLITTENIVYPNGIDVLLPGAEPQNTPYPSLGWEESVQTNFGLDLRAWGGKVSFAFDYFNKTTKNLLTPGTSALSAGLNSSFVNAGDVENKGFEFDLGLHENIGEFKININANLTYLKNEVTFLNETTGAIGGADLPTLGTLTYFELGQPVWYFKGFETAGIFRDQEQINQWLTDNNITDAGYAPQPGDPIIVNHVDDGTINDEDMTNIGSPQPSLLYGINIGLEYKGFDFNMFMQGVSGNEIFMGFVRADRGRVNRLEYFYDNRWTAENPNSSLPRADYLGSQFLKSDLMVQDGSYLKIRQIQLGYTLPNSVTESIKVSRARIYVSLNDFFTFTNYIGVDPEVGSGENNRQGVDFGMYPVSKKVLGGISVSF